MQMVKKIFVALLVLWFAFLWLMPKQELYYKLEQTLEKSAIKINEKQIDEGFFTLTLHEADVYAKGIKLATVEKVSLFTLLFYTHISIEKLVLDDSLKSMAPTNIDYVNGIHKIWNPLNISLDAEGTFGTLSGKADAKERSLRIDFNASKGIEMLKPKLKQDEKGWYYETSF
jgi:hypothetical protein